MLTFWPLFVRPMMKISSIWRQYKPLSTGTCIIIFKIYRYLFTIHGILPHWNDTGSLTNKAADNLATQEPGHMVTLWNGNIFGVTPFVRGIHRWIPRTKASDAELWCFLWSAPWINGWVNNREAGDLRRHRAYYDVDVMHQQYWYWPSSERTGFSTRRVFK